MTALLVEVALLLVGARLAAELAVRMGQPVVLVEIVFGLALGPSAFALVAPSSEPITLLAELGAILLLLEVGLHMDLERVRDLLGPAMRVALIGMVAPLALGFVSMRLLGLPAAVAIFLAAGTTATSVGVTARVFADLRVLASIESRTVLGAAVIDDVGGLLILATVSRIGDGDGLDPLALMRVLVIALTFLMASGTLGARLLPRALDALGRRARTEGLVPALAIAITIGLAALAGVAGLATIVGAFAAGTIFSRSAAREQIVTATGSLGKTLIPLFFLHIGAQTDIRAIASPRVLLIAGVLTAMAVIGKVVAGAGAGRRGGDALLVGIGMIPRGEVGVIFAGIGLASGTLDVESHAALVLVVLLTTVIGPPAIKARLRRLSPTALALPDSSPHGWLSVTDDSVELNAMPDAVASVSVAVEAALACDGRRPGGSLLTWLSAAPLQASFGEIVPLLRAASARPWHILRATGALDRLLPELATAIARFPVDPFDVDPEASLRPLADRRIRTAVASLDSADVVLLAAVARAAVMTEREAIDLCHRLGCTGPDRELVRFLLTAPEQIRAFAAGWDMTREDPVLALAAHIGTRDRCAPAVALALAGADGDERERVEQLADLLDKALDHPELTGHRAMTLVEQRRAAAIEATGTEAAAFVKDAPWRYVLERSASDIERHARLAASRLARGEVRLEAEPVSAGRWILHIVLEDRPGSLAAIAGTLARAQIRVDEASAFGWPDGIAVDVITVRAPTRIDWAAIEEDLSRALAGGDGLAVMAPLDVALSIDSSTSPWHTIVHVNGDDRTGLLHRVTSALARADVDIHAAIVSTNETHVHDTFWVTTRAGDRLDARDIERLEASFAGRRPRGRNKLVTRT